MRHPSGCGRRGAAPAVGSRPVPPPAPACCQAGPPPPARRAARPVFMPGCRFSKDLSNGTPLTCAPPSLLTDFSSELFSSICPLPQTLVDERLCAEDDGECEPFGVLGAGFGGVDRDP